MKKSIMALVLCALILCQCAALADGLALRYGINNEYPSVFNGRVRFQSFAYDYDGYVSGDGKGDMPYYADDDFIRIITKSASVWSKPKTNSKKLGTVSHGDELVCEIDEYDNAQTEGDFFVVEYKGETGYVNQAYAVLSPLEIVLMESNVPAYIAPFDGAKCVGSLSKHTRYTVIGMYDDYYIVNLRGAAAAFIRKDVQCYDSRFEKLYDGMETFPGVCRVKTAMRTGPGENFAKVEDMKPGTEFECYDMIGPWYMLRYTPKNSKESFFVFVYCNDVDVPDIANG